MQNIKAIRNPSTQTEPDREQSTKPSPRALPGGHLPHLDGLVAGGADDEVARRRERHARDVVVVAVHRLQALVVAREAPQLDGHVGTARH